MASDMENNDGQYDEPLIEMNVPAEAGADEDEQSTNDSDPSGSFLDDQAEYTREMEIHVLRKVIRLRSRPNYLVWAAYALMAILAFVGIFIIPGDSWYQWGIWGAVVGIIILMVDVHNDDSWDLG